MQRFVGLGLLLAACGTDGSTGGVDAAPAIDAPPADAPVDAAPVIHGCTPGAITDLTAPGATRTITADNDLYTPSCLRIRVGQTVTWSMDLAEHPLEPGIRRSGEVEAQPGTPITSTGSGFSLDVTFPAEGEWAFFCPNHPPGMVGVVFVVP